MSLRSLILRNFWLKTFSVVLATVIWFFIHDGIRHEAALADLTNRPLPHEVHPRSGHAPDQPRRHAGFSMYAQ